MAIYDRIGRTYTATRQTDPKIAERIWAALGDARSVLNVGAGSGSYEPVDRDVVAVDPSQTMLAQRPAGAAPAVQALLDAREISEAVSQLDADLESGAWQRRHATLLDCEELDLGFRLVVAELG